MLARKLSKILLSTTAVVGALTNLVGCEEGAKAPQDQQSVKVHAIKLVYPPEARTLISNAVAVINSKNIQLKNGSVVRLSASSFDNLAAFEKIGTPQMPAVLWIAPFTPLAASVRRSLQADVSIKDCNSTMSSRLGVTYRQIDSFTVPVTGGAVNLSQILLPSELREQREPSIVVGSPRFTSVGLITALSAAAIGTSTSLSALNSDVVTKNLAGIQKTQSFVRNYYISEYDTLKWLSERQGGEPVFVLTTEQGFNTHHTYNKQSDLLWSPVTGPSATLDYPLCSVINKSDSAQDLEAANAVRLFFASEEFKSMLKDAGFSPPASLGDINSAQLGATAGVLISEWPNIRRPSMTVFVVDASIKTDRTALETIRREIKLFVESRPSPNDSVAIVSASTSPEIISEPSSNPEFLLVALSRLTTAGGNAVRDGVLTAFTMFSDLKSRNFRRAVVVFTSSKDTSSQTSITQLTNRATQLVGRKNVDLFVFGLGSKDSDFGELPSLTQEVGGSFINTNVASLPADLFPVTRRVQ